MYKAWSKSHNRNKKSIITKVRTMAQRDFYINKQNDMRQKSFSIPYKTSCHIWHIIFTNHIRQIQNLEPYFHCELWCAAADTIEMPLVGYKYTYSGIKTLLIENVPRPLYHIFPYISKKSASCYSPHFSNSWILFLSWVFDHSIYVYQYVCMWVKILYPYILQILLKRIPK